jgi:hypothetical protein
MNLDPDRLYKLLPAVYQQRDFEAGGPLKALLGVISEQVNAVDRDIGRTYQNWFIETCEEWAIPYIGELIGYQVATPASLPDSLATADDRALESVLIPRRDVAATVGFRLRKGTLAILEQLATDLTGWSARAVELDQRWAITQSLKSLRPRRGRIMDLRARRVLERLGGAFDPAGRTVRLDDHDLPRGGAADVLNKVRLYLWRLKVFALDRVPAHCLVANGDRCFTFSALGDDLPLYARPGAALAGAAARPDRAVLPGPITRLELAEERPRGHRGRLRTSPAYYGAGKSLAVWAPQWAGLDGTQPVPAHRVIPADLSAWRYEPPPEHIAVDPELGRIAFPPGQLPAGGVWVTYCYAAPAALGAGPYPRRLAYPAGAPVYFVGGSAQYESIGQALGAWRKEAPARAIIEVIDNAIYVETLRVDLAAGQQLEIRASSGARPVIKLFDRRGNRPIAFAVAGDAGSALRLDGLVLEGRSIEIEGCLRSFSVRDCTLIAGFTRDADGRPPRSPEPSLSFVDTAVAIRVERSITGAIRVIRARPDLAPSPCLIDTSIVDAQAEAAPAIGGESGRNAGIALTLRRSTILGAVRVHAIVLAENAIFAGEVHAARRQQGCVRCCYVPPGSRTPPRFQCQPDLAERTLDEALEREHLSAEERSSLFSAMRHRVKPVFTSTRRGAPGYFQLAQRCPREISRGAEDAAEMGVYHDLFVPQREDMLLERIAGSVPLGVAAGITFVD